jgi:hypothetical protein
MSPTGEHFAFDDQSTPLSVVEFIVVHRYRGQYGYPPIAGFLPKRGLSIENDKKINDASTG